MGKARRYTNKLSKARNVPNIDERNQEKQEMIEEKIDYQELAEYVMNSKMETDRMSVSTIVKNIKFENCEAPNLLKKEHKRNLKHAVLIKRLERTQDLLNKNKKKKKSGENDDNVEDDVEDMTSCLNESNQKVLDWPVRNMKNIVTKIVHPKKFVKGYQKKQNAKLARELALYSQKIKLHLS